MRLVRTFTRRRKVAFIKIDRVYLSVDLLRHAMAQTHHSRLQYLDTLLWFVLSVVRVLWFVLSLWLEYLFEKGKA